MNTIRTPSYRILPVNGIDLALFDWPESDTDSGAPTLIFAHATGFHARVWDAVIEHFPENRVIAFDMRGHGRSGGGPIEDWRVMVRDVTQALDALGVTNAIGVGHSMGGHVLLQTAVDRPGLCSRLVLFDPVIMPPEFYAAEQPLFSADNPHPTSRRKRDFSSAEAMIERFRDRDPYCLFDVRVFEDYCRHGLLPAANGTGMELACPPEVEGSIYASSRSNRGILEAARHLDIPVLVVRAQQSDLNDFKGSPTWPELARILPQGTDMHRPDRTHFHPFEDPADAARIITEFMG